MRAAVMAIIAMIGAAQIWLAQQHAGRGVVLKVDESQRTLAISCEEIPGYMAAMAMSFSVHDPKLLEGLKPGVTVTFTIAEQDGTLFADNLRVTTLANFESEPMEAGQLTALHKAIDPSAAAKELQLGQHFPDFSFTDQAGKQVSFSQLQGKVLAFTFSYSRCPNPNYCFRLSNNLARLEKRFSGRVGRDLVLATIVIDPEHDQGGTLSDYADTWKADPAVWHFMTAPLPEVKQVARVVGMDFWSDEGLLTHSFHTIVLDRQGRLAANLEGNQFTAEQLGDLIQTVMDKAN